MELRQYGRILWKRAWIIAGLTLLSGIVGFLVSPARDGYEATLRVAIGVQPEERRESVYQYDRYYTFLASEYLADDFGEVVKSQAFLEDVQKEMGNTPVALGSIFGDRGAKKTHRLVTLTVTAKGQDQARQIADAVLRVMENKGNQYLAQLGSDRAVVRVVDPPQVYPASRGQRALLDLGLRTGLGLLAGLALVLLLEYLDNTVRDRTEAEGVLGLTVLGELPPE
jgi:capsular polysaccharide biosynthesis protein